MNLNRLSPGRAHPGHRLRMLLCRENGQTLVEFAISISIFLAVTIGIIIVCMAMFTYEYVDFAAREATRWAAVRGADCYLSSQTMPGCGSTLGATATDIQNYVEGLDYPLIDPTKLTGNVNVAWFSETPYTNTTTNTTYATWTTCTPPSTPPANGNGCNDPGDAVQVSISYPFSFGIDIPFVGSFTPTVSSTSQMVISQ